MRARAFIAHMRVHHCVFQRLIAADQLAELLARFQIIERVIDNAIGAAAHFRRRQQGGGQFDMRQRVGRSTRIHQRIGWQAYTIQHNGKGAPRFIDNFLAAYRLWWQRVRGNNHEVCLVINGHGRNHKSGLVHIGHQIFRAGKRQLIARHRTFTGDMGKVPVAMVFAKTKRRRRASRQLR